MKLKSIIINNYKSFGEQDNFLFVDKLNVVLGKNESGKSNLVDALSKINMIGLTDKDYFLPKNRKNNKDINVILNFETYKGETTFYGFEGNANVTLESYNNYSLSGELSEFISNNSQYNTILKQIEEIKSTGIFFQQQEDRKKFNNLIEDLNNAKTKIFIEHTFYKNIINSLKNSTGEKNKNIAQLIQDAIDFLDNIYCAFPSFVKIEDMMLKSRYNVENVKLDILLEKFFDICNIDIEELISKMNSKDIADIRNYERDINKNIKNNFSDEFNKFYSQENVNIEIAISLKEINIIVDTSNRYLDYEERSNGLKWYISAFIQLLYMEKENCKSNKNNIIIMDEPGVYLHPNAQKELISLFNNLIKNENQIIYTTHSPFMVNIDTIQNVRTVMKDDEGFSHIYNKITKIPTNLNATYDTITPLTNALGLNLDYNIGPSFQKKNIIVEGITDYFYLQGFFKCKNVKKVPNIIPSTGANNIPAIASILFGWNCDFHIILDQDTGGHSTFDSINDSKQPFIENIIFVDGNTNKVSEKIFEIENLFSTADKSKFEIDKTDYSEHKYNYSYVTYNKILLGEEIYDTETMKNFENLLQLINI